MTNTNTIAAAAAPAHSGQAIAHGLHAVARHLIDNKLPAPLNIAVGRSSRCVEVQVTTDTEHQWVDSIAIDNTATERHDVEPGVQSVRSITTGRVGLGVRIRVVAVRFIPTEVRA